MDFVIDGVLILTCLSAGFYCFLLSRRLRRFADTKSGIGEQIVSLNAALEEMRAAMPALKRDVEEAAEILSKRIAQSQKIKAEIQRKTEQLEHAAEEMAKATAKRTQPRSVLDPGTPEPDKSTGRRTPALSDDAPESKATRRKGAVSATGEPDDDDGADGDQRLGFMPDSPGAEASAKPSPEDANGNMLSVERMLL